MNRRPYALVLGATLVASASPCEIFDLDWLHEASRIAEVRVIARRDDTLVVRPLGARTWLSGAPAPDGDEETVLLPERPAVGEDREAPGTEPEWGEIPPGSFGVHRGRLPGPGQDVLLAVDREGRAFMAGRRVGATVQLWPVAELEHGGITCGGDALDAQGGKGANSWDWDRCAHPEARIDALRDRLAKRAKPDDR